MIVIILVAGCTVAAVESTRGICQSGGTAPRPAAIRVCGDKSQRYIADRRTVGVDLGEISIHASVLKMPTTTIRATAEHSLDQTDVGGFIDEARVLNRRGQGHDMALTGTALGVPGDVEVACSAEQIGVVDYVVTVA